MIANPGEQLRVRGKQLAAHCLSSEQAVNLRLQRSVSGMLAEKTHRNARTSGDDTLA